MSGRKADRYGKPLRDGNELAYLVVVVVVVVINEKQSLEALTP